MNEPLTHSFVRSRLVPLLDGNLNEAEARQIKAHLRQCRSCHEAFLKTAAQGVFRAQVAFRAGRRGSPWVYLQALAQRNVDWAKEELQQIKGAVGKALPMYLQQQRAAMTGIPTLGEETHWPDTFNVEIVDAAGQLLSEHKLVFEVIQPPTVTRAGEFLFSARTHEMGLEDCTLFCTVDAVGGSQVTFETVLEREADSPVSAAEALKRLGAAEQVPWRAMIRASGLPAPDQDVVIPRVRAHLVLQRSEHHDA